MTDVGRRGVFPPPANLYRIPIMHLSGLWSAGRRLADEAEAPTSRLVGWARRVVEALRQRIFVGRFRSAEDYEEPHSEMSAFLRSCGRIFWALAAFSGMSNLLMLTGSFFMLQVYDRVLPGRSIPTLIALLVLAAVLYLFQGGLDFVRSRISARVGRYFDERLGIRIFDALVRLPLKTRADGDGLQPVRDLDQVRSFLSSGGPTALFDLPWMPIYLGVCFLFHFWIGVTALAGALVLIGITMLTETRTRGPAKASSRLAVSRTALALEGRRNAEVLQAMGMRQQAALRWRDVNAKYLAAHERASDVANSLGGASKIFRAILQSLVLAVGAVLVINQESTAGIIIAGSILSARALAPVELAIANWKGFVAARQSGQRLNALLKLLPSEEERLELPPPVDALSVENLFIGAPNSERPTVNDVSFQLRRGQAVGIIGPSGSGKSTLARALVGVWPGIRGRIRLDNAALDHWSSDALGKHIGYMPQDVELFDGSVAMNIARFDPQATAAAVLEAAHAAGAHDLILSFPEGYGTKIGEGGVALSAGQRQRIGLARAFYGKPFLVVLDEPSSNLDAEGEEALTEAILNVRRRGGIAVVIAHRPKALEAVDHVLCLGEGRVQSFGKREEVLKKVLRNPVPLKVVAEAQGGNR
ncbi:PrtD family type I secretion system ABC transporter [Bradyrhizobium ottawaense]|uniref:PrtD family type I secretion system ABC transporter n=2 Tax=Nitrobacteraceae TaxID=41294 RepID=A0ABV4G159_9BRAD|nr:MULTISPECIES: type I secretion system permease/ATPase [Bradyrhizobium]MBR1289917.1 type I secretion system permease/ATPase [Bradyrhizobium ottawaense]PDT64178.1 type I secretion system permease/ATPase [Bradyrhizobium ottawaense]